MSEGEKYDVLEKIGTFPDAHATGTDMQSLTLM
jgi:hypothetical protein